MRLDILRRSYDRFAAQYDDIFAPQQTPKIEALASALPRPLPGPGLDAGAGTGLCSRVMGVELTQLDASRGMLALASGRRVQGELARMPFRAGAFGLVVSVTALIDFLDPGPVVAEFARVLRPGGWLALSVLKVEDIAAVQAALELQGLVVRQRLDLVQDIGFVCRRGG